ncbi:hypothetical protein QL285_007262 [Trifolium repens]|jgi:hypothetical protein|nr:hypothetical protein QL285_007262 [Trifolium repens]
MGVEEVVEGLGGGVVDGVSYFTSSFHYAGTYPKCVAGQSDPDAGYSVCGAYQLLTSQDSFPLGEVADLVWHRLVPLNVSILVWRLLHDRLPTKTNLVARGIISLEAHFCVSGCGSIESAQHLFLSCNTFGSLWALVRSWIGFSAVDAHTLPDHFVQLTYSAGGC